MLGILFIYLNSKVVFHVGLPERHFYFPQVSVWILLGPWTVKKSMYSLLLNMLEKNFFNFLNAICCALDWRSGFSCPK